MKLVSYLAGGRDALGLLLDGDVYPVGQLHSDWPATMQELLVQWERWIERLLLVEHQIKEGRGQYDRRIALAEISLLSPVPHPTSCRDGYAFRRHVEAARANRGLSMTREFDEYPVFYFTNHQSVQGPGKTLCMPDHFDKLDFELEAAVVICKEGRNILATEANQYIGGLMIMNDLTARSLQMQEMLLNLGPAKGKDFATALGPWLVTLDELEAFSSPCKPGHTGISWNLRMSASVNGERVSEGNLADMDWTFAELIERASYGVTLYPGDVIGSGTVGTGCFMELNGTNGTSRWLQAGDTVELEIEGLGQLKNTIAKEQTGHSLLAKKKI